MLMNRLSEPDSSQTLARKPGNRESIRSRTSRMVPASTSTTSAPEVNFRSGVGMRTLSDMIPTSKGFLECRQLRFDDFRHGNRYRIQSFQTISGNRQYDELIPFKPSLGD